jgi:adenosylcobinamide kinase/adenosylcobinamide-phosphate guanylyltransferase
VLHFNELFVDTKNDISLCLEQAKAEIDAIANQENTTIIIVVRMVWGFTDTAVGRKFTELQGWMNQYIAATADTVVLMVSGIPVTIKEKK